MGADGRKGIRSDGNCGREEPNTEGKLERRERTPIYRAASRYDGRRDGVVVRRLHLRFFLVVETLGTWLNRWMYKVVLKDFLIHNNNSLCLFLLRYHCVH